MQNIQDKLSVMERLAAPTPKLFQYIRNVGVVLSVISGALMGLEKGGIDLPDHVMVLADKAYLMAGLIATALAQLTVDVKEYEIQNALK